jgi:hypothetical protein
MTTEAVSGPSLTIPRITPLEAALAYARRGWKVVPLCQNAKIPAFAGWQEKATSDEEIIRRWWGSPGLYEFAGIGIVTGSVSGIWVLDLDVKNPDADGLKSFENLIQTHHGATHPLIVETPSGGKHLYFRYPGVHVPGKVAILPGIDVRGDGGFVVAPPTRLNGGEYLWKTTATDPDLAPRWLSDMVTTAASINTDRIRVTGDICLGTRYTTLRRMRCSLRRQGIPENIIEGVVRGLNTQCTGGQPLDGAEIAKVLSTPVDIPQPDLRVVDQKFEIQIGGEIDRISDRVIHALTESNNPPRYFVRDSVPYRVARNENDRLNLQILEKTRMTHEVARLCSFYRVKPTVGDDEGIPIPCAIPVTVIADILAAPLLPFPALVGYTETPFITPGGTLITSEGYDPETQLYYAPCGGLDVAGIPDEPTDDDIRTSFDLLEEVICDFPFQSQADKENCIAALIHPLLRPTVKGFVPILIIDKPQPGVGGSLISDVIHILATGTYADKKSEAQTEEEWEKRLDAVLLSGQLIAIIDNVHNTLKSAALASAVTAFEKSLRILGESRQVKVANRTLWIVNGNNVTISDEIARRCFRVRLESLDPQPWKRDENRFRHPDLLDWVVENRAAIIRAVLTIIRAWMVRKTPVLDTLPRMGSFREWRQTLGGIMAMGGYQKFLTNLDQLYGDAESDTPEWDEFLQLWYNNYQNRPVPVKDLKPWILNNSHIQDNLPEQLQEAKFEGSFAIVLGKALGKIKDQKFPSGYYVHLGSKLNGNQVWSVHRLGEHH